MIREEPWLGPLPHYAQCPCSMATSNGVLFVLTNLHPDCTLHGEPEEWLEPGLFPGFEPARCSECKKIMTPYSSEEDQKVLVWVGGVGMYGHWACLMDPESELPKFFREQVPGSEGSNK